MAYHKNNLSFEKMLLKFIGEPDPMLSMLEWLCHKMMGVEVTSKLGASKNEHSHERKSIFPAPEFVALTPAWEPCSKPRRNVLNKHCFRLFKKHLETGFQPESKRQAA